MVLANYTSQVESMKASLSIIKSMAQVDSSILKQTFNMKACGKKIKRTDKVS